MSEPDASPPRPSDLSAEGPRRPVDGPGGARASEVFGGVGGASGGASGASDADRGGDRKRSSRDLFAGERDGGEGAEAKVGLTGEAPEPGEAEGRGGPRVPGMGLPGVGGEGGALGQIAGGNSTEAMVNDVAELLDANTTEERRAELIAEGAAQYAAGDVGKAAMKELNKNEDVQLVVQSTYKGIKALVAIILVLIFGFGFLLANSSLNQVDETLSGTTSAGGVHQRAANKLGPAVEEYMRAGEAYQVPWTVIAAVATGATESGKFSPYDALDRDPHRKGLRRPSGGTTVTAGVGSFIPAGTSRLAWAQSLAQAIGANNEAAVRFLVAWSKWEQSNPKNNNPLSTREEMPGAVVMTNDKGEENAHGVKRYPDPATGLAASIINLTGSPTGQLGAVGGNGVPKGYPAVVNALRAGDLPGTSAALTTRDPISKRQYCAPREGKIGENDCAMYRKGLILTKAAKYVSDPAVYQRENAEQILSGPVGTGSTSAPTGPAPSAPAPVSSVAGPSLASVSVTIVGDSSCAGAAGRTLVEALRARRVLPVLLCRDARQLADADGTLNGYLTPATGVLVVSLGTDEQAMLDAATVHATLEALVARAGGIPVLLVSPAPARPATAAFQTAAALLAAAHPTVRVVDATTPAVPAWVDSDGVHPSRVGALARADLIATGVTQVVTTGPGGAVVGATNPSTVKVASFPVVRPAIGGQPGQGVGPFLLRPSALVGSRFDAQALTFSGRDQLRTATDWVARALAQQASRLRQEGVSARAKPEAFWAEVIRRLPLVDPRNPECQAEVVAAAGVGDRQQRVAGAIRSAWACELGRTAGLETVVGLDADGTTRTITGYAEQSLVVREALQVAWAYSQWGSAPCDDNAPEAGVFPLSKAIFTTYAPPTVVGNGRCDAGANIGAAVRAFIAGESVPVGERRGGEVGGLGDRTTAAGPYNPLVGGWAAMPWVLGDAAARAQLVARGPNVAWVPEPACLDAVDAWVLGGPKPTCGDPAAVARLGRTRGLILYQQLSAHRALLGPTPTEGDLAPPVVPSDPAGLDRRFTVVAGTDLAAATALQARTDAFLGSLAGTPTVGETRGGTDVVVTRLRHASVVAIPSTTLTDRDDYALALARLARDIGGLARGDSLYQKVLDPFLKLVRLFGGGEAEVAVTLPATYPDAGAYNAAGQTTGLDPRMLAAVSEADPDRARALEACRTQAGPGPQGLMVLQPATAQLVGVNPCDTPAAVLAVAKLLAGHRSRYGAWEQAWAAKKYGVEAVDQDRVFTHTPEAGAYVRAVAARWAELRQLYPPPMATSVGGSGAGVQAVNFALAQLGKPYVFASRGPNTFDCSGLMHWSYKQIGIKVTPFTGAEVHEGVGIADYHDFGNQPIPYAHMVQVAAPGDLLLFKGGDGSLGSGYPGHVGMYIGDGKMVHAPRTGDVVKVVPLNGRSDLMYIRRMATG